MFPGSSQISIKGLRPDLHLILRHIRVFRKVRKAAPEAPEP
jgi:hypothetical protein